MQELLAIKLIPTQHHSGVGQPEATPSLMDVYKQTRITRQLNPMIHLLEILNYNGNTKTKLTGLLVFMRRGKTVHSMILLVLVE